MWLGIVSRGGEQSHTLAVSTHAYVSEIIFFAGTQSTQYFYDHNVPWRHGLSDHI